MCCRWRRCSLFARRLAYSPLGWNAHTNGEEGVNFEFTFLERILLAGQVPWFYLSKLAWPANLIFVYPRWTLNTGVWWQWVFFAATVGATFLLWKLRRRSRAVGGRLFFLGTLFPVLGFLNVYPFIFSYVADHFQYLASLGIISSIRGGANSGRKTLAAANSAITALECQIAKSN